MNSDHRLIKRIFRTGNPLGARSSALLIFAALLLGSCAPLAPQGTPIPSPIATDANLQPPAAATVSETPDTGQGPAINRRVSGFEAVNVHQMLPIDGIRPIYEPEFRSAAEAPLQDDELVLGVALGENAKAYPITVLRFREMVNDELAGIPTLVTW